MLLQDRPTGTLPRALSPPQTARNAQTQLNALQSEAVSWVLLLIGMGLRRPAQVTSSRRGLRLPSVGMVGNNSRAEPRCQGENCTGAGSQPIGR